jgi:hypothetical protein
MVPRKRVLLLTGSTPKVKGKVLLAGSSKIDFEKLENFGDTIDEVEEVDQNVRVNRSVQESRNKNDAIEIDDFHRPADNNDMDGRDGHAEAVGSQSKKSFGGGRSGGEGQIHFGRKGTSVFLILAILLHKEYGDEPDQDDEQDEEERPIPEFVKGETIPIVRSQATISHPSIIHPSSVYFLFLIFQSNTHYTILQSYTHPPPRYPSLYPLIHPLYTYHPPIHPSYFHTPIIRHPPNHHTISHPSIIPPSSAYFLFRILQSYTHPSIILSSNHTPDFLEQNG